MEGARSLFQKALDVSPNHPAALYSLAATCINQGHAVEALDYAERCVRANLFSPLSWYIFSASLLANERPLESFGAASRALELAPNHIDSMLVRGSVLLKLDLKDQALSEFQKILQLDPSNPIAQKNQTALQAASGQKLMEAETLSNQGLILQAAGDITGARALFQQALSLHAENFAALYSLAVVCLTLGDHEEGLVYAEKCVREHSRSAMSWYIRGCALKMLRRFSEAVSDFDQAIELSPTYKEAHSEKGLTCAELDNYLQSLIEFNEVLKIDPENKLALSNAAMILTMLKKNDEASNFYSKLLSLDPEYEYALGALVHARLHDCDWTDYEPNLERITQGVRENKKSCRPLAFLGLSDSPADQLACIKLFMSISYPPVPGADWKSTPYKHDKLRIAYLSPDLREHPVGHLMAGVFEHHDKSKFDIYSFSLGVNDNSNLRSRFIAASNHFFDVRGQSSAQIAKLIQEHEIDVLIDLAGPTADARPDVLSRHPAPVQVAYLGYAGSTGAPYIDYIIADETVIPEDHKPHYIEKVLHLPGCYLPTDPEVTISERTPTRAEMSLPENGFVFCSFNHNHKITPPVFDSWMRILSQVPASILWLTKSSPYAEANLRKEAQRRGIEPERLVFAGRVPSISDHLARYRIPGLFLDTSPYNAHSTATDVLRVGLPVLTLEGNSFQSRVATSIVRAIGMPELAVPTWKDYEAFAIEVGNSPEKAANLRTRVEQQVQAAESFNPKLKTEALERLYMVAHQRGSSTPH